MDIMKKFRIFKKKENTEPVIFYKTEIIVSYTTTILYQYRANNIDSKIFEFSGNELTFIVNSAIHDSFFLKLYVSNPSAIENGVCSIKIGKYDNSNNLIAEIIENYDISAHLETNNWKTIYLK
jgi:hypothetical protein